MFDDWHVCLPLAQLVPTTATCYKDQDSDARSFMLMLLIKFKLIYYLLSITVVELVFQVFLGGDQRLFWERAKKKCIRAPLALLNNHTLRTNEQPVDPFVIDSKEGNP